jgi:hypothetical protein
MITSVDTNILLDILIPDAPAMEASQCLLDAGLQQGGLVISEIVYADTVGLLCEGDGISSAISSWGPMQRSRRISS